MRSLLAAAPALLAVVLLAPIAAADTELGDYRALTAAYGDQSSPAIVFTGSAPIVTWREAGVRAGKIGGGPIAVPTVLSDTQPAAVAIASLGDEQLVVWIDGKRIMACHLDANAQPRGEAFRVSDEADANALLTVAASRDQYLIAWSGPTGYIVDALVGRNGNVASLPLAVARPSDWQIRALAAASNGTDFLVTWEAALSGELEVRSSFVDQNGSQKWAFPTTVASHSGAPDVVWNGREFLLIWTALEATGGGLRAQRYAADMSRIGGVIRVTTGDEYVPRIAWDGSGYAVAAMRHANFHQYQFDHLFAMRLTAEGQPAEPLTSNALAAGISTGDYDIAAHDGNIVLVFRSGGLQVTSAIVGAPRKVRPRAVGH